MKRVIRTLVMAAIIFAAMQVGWWVNKAMAQSVQLNWGAVVQNCDLSVANDIAGYVILWGTNLGGPYPNEHIVSTPSISTTIDVGSQEGSSVYFVAVAYDINSNRSDDPGGCGTSPELVVNFPMVLPSPPSLLTGVVVP
jgi:hypothetical protein